MAENIMVKLSSEGNGYTITSEFKVSRDEMALVLGQKMFEIELLTRTFITSQAYPGILEKIMPYFDKDISNYNDYQSRVRSMISPDLNEEERNWLERETQIIRRGTER